MPLLPIVRSSMTGKPDGRDHRSEAEMLLFGSTKIFRPPKGRRKIFMPSHTIEPRMSIRHKKSWFDDVSSVLKKERNYRPIRFRARSVFFQAFQKNCRMHAENLQKTFAIREKNFDIKYFSALL